MSWFARAAGSRTSFALPRVKATSARCAYMLANARGVPRRSARLPATASRRSRSEERRVGKEGRSRVGRYQAEDGIRDHCVTGVQTCALPILVVALDGEVLLDELVCACRRLEDVLRPAQSEGYECAVRVYVGERAGRAEAFGEVARHREQAIEIGRASCRERG